MPWRQLSFVVARGRIDPLSELLTALGAQAVTFVSSAEEGVYEPPPGATPLWESVRVTGLFPADVDVDETLELLRQGMSPEPLPPCEIASLEDREWTREWMFRYGPMRFGKRLRILPSWCEDTYPKEVVVRLDPGVAFGTGTHPTTALCLEWLAVSRLAGALLVDYGCGSGILAIAGVKLGANRAIAVDHDHQALASTVENARRNAVAGAVTAVLPQQLPAVAADVVLANILARPLMDLAPRLARLIKTGGKLVLSGILESQLSSVADHYRPWFVLEPPVAKEGWLRLTGQRVAH